MKLQAMAIYELMLFDAYFDRVASQLISISRVPWYFLPRRAAPIFGAYKYMEYLVPHVATTLHSTRRSLRLSFNFSRWYRVSDDDWASRSLMMPYCHWFHIEDSRPPPAPHFTHTPLPSWASRLNVRDYRQSPSTILILLSIDGDYIDIARWQGDIDWFILPPILLYVIH